LNEVETITDIDDLKIGIFFPAPRDFLFSDDDSRFRVEQDFGSGVCVSYSPYALITATLSAGFSLMGTTRGHWRTALRLATVVGKAEA